MMGLCMQDLKILYTPIKALGQSFLINEKIVKAEAAHSDGKIVLEIGPGYGILTGELCKKAKKVIAVEKDENLYMLLKGMKCKNLNLINKDFFKLSPDEIDIESVDIMIANIPYALSSKIIEWLGENGLEAVLCLQKEFVDRMIADAGSKEYSRLSVMTSLLFSVTKIMDVPRGNFRPMPKVDSALIYMKPKKVQIKELERKLIGLIMQHKKKTLRSAVLDCGRQLGIEKKALAEVADRLELREARVFRLSPEEILGIAEELGRSLKIKAH